jgi:hypothetical protein
MKSALSQFLLYNIWTLLLIVRNDARLTGEATTKRQRGAGDRLVTGDTA